MVLNSGYCSCETCTSQGLFGCLKNAAITVAILVPPSFAFYFWAKKRRLNKQLFRKKDETKIPNQTSEIDYNYSPKSINNNEKRLETAVDTLTRGMKITNKRLLQLSEQVLTLRRRLEEISTQKERRQNKNVANYIYDN
ncbi:uncharacterized protein [Rhodnius prolixus]|uniref:uncharacterized protein n=1 Tax=Rhodnius prolixus TaxID=13249 RepID=UPI003D18BF7E